MPAALRRSPTVTISAVTRLVGVGLAVGIAASLGVTRFLQSLLYRVNPLHARTRLFATLS